MTLLSVAAQFFRSLYHSGHPQDGDEMGAIRPLEYYHDHWQTCEVLEDRRVQIEWAVSRIVDNMTDYGAVEEITGVPWKLVGALHYREANCDLSRSLHNGDPWTQETVHIPRERGPFGSWIDSARDALALKRYDNRPEYYWCIARMLRAAEQYNGWGYSMRGKPSPYVWNWTNHGKGAGYFTADGHYDPKAVNKQAGVAAILKALED